MHGVAEWLRGSAPWLLEPSLGVCVVGSTALAEACRRAGLHGPEVHDLDLSWAPAVDDGEALLRRHGVLQPTTAANRARGTLALKLDGRRIEITSLRDGDPTASLHDRLVADAGGRDMTVGAILWLLAEDRIVDPAGGLEDWRARVVRAVGEPAARIAEHPVRWLRYYRRAHSWDFALDPRVRKLPVDGDQLRRIPPEALAAEVRSALLECRSPGRFFVELFEAGVLAEVLPELAAQFDGRPAGPVRHHPEIGQALHVVLCSEWIEERSRTLPEADRLAVRLAVLLHDLGKSATPAPELPAHRGHENAGVPLIERFLQRVPGLADARARRLALTVCRLHLELRRFDALRPGTLAKMYEREFRAADFPVELCALAVGADSGGRLGLEAEGEVVAERVARDVRWLREVCVGVDAAALARAHAGDVPALRRALHEARARAIAAARRPG